ncbi:hypothetical protein BASA81_002106 [Batrachochytrium salamandrivorans]|nr:hypothetical protein BASA81_002106 [Batrachochytrium salamandrivorans]
MASRQKEACELVLDLCMPEPSLAFPKELSKLHVAKQCADIYMRRFLQEQRKTDVVGIVTLGSMGCNEELGLQSAHMSHRKLLLDLEPDSSATGEELQDAMQLARECIAAKTKKLKYKRTLVLFTDGSKCSNLVRLQREKDQMEQYEAVNWEVFGIDFGFAGRAAELVDGEANLVQVFGEECIRAITRAEDMFKLSKRVVGQVKKWKGELEISPFCKLHCVMVARVAEDKLKSLVKRSRLVLDGDEFRGKVDEFLETSRGEVKMDRKYTSGEDVGRELDVEERSRAFRYGKDLLPMFPADEEQMKLKDTASCLKVIGIIPASELTRQYMISATNCIVADPGSANSQQGFSAFVIGLRELGKVCTCRFVPKDGKAPKLVALVPGQTSQGIDCLWHVQLPTMEDIRDYQFETSASNGSLTAVSKMEEEITERYVKAMTFGRNDAVETKQFDPEATFNPYIARYWEVVHFKAVHPELPVPPTSHLVSAMISVDPKMLNRSARSARQFKKVLGLNRLVQRKELSAAIDISAPRVREQPIDGGEEEDGGEAVWFPDEEKALVEFVGNINPVEDFWSIMGREGMELDAIRQLKQVVLDMVGPTTGDAIYYAKALDCLKAMREACIKAKSEQTFNDFMLALKDGLLFESLDSEFWKRMAEEQIELIDCAEHVSQEFYSSTQTSLASQPSSNHASQPKIFDEELFDEME